MLRKAIIPMAALFPMLGGCAAVQSSAQPVVEHTYAAARVTVGPCVFGEGRAEAVPAFVVPLITFAIDRGLNLVGTTLRKAGEAKETVVSGFGNFEMDEAELSQSCVQVVRGSFVADAADYPKNPPDWAIEMGMNPQNWSVLRNRLRLFLATAPDFFFEGAIAPSTNGSAMTIQPLYAILNRPAESPMLDPSGGTRHVVVLISFVPPDSELDAATNPGTEVVLGRLEPGRYIRFRVPIDEQPSLDDDLDGTEPPDAEASEVDSGSIVESRGGRLPWPAESRWFKLTSTGASGPMTARAVVKETKSANQMFLFLADAFDEVKDELKEDVKDRLLPAERIQARLTELNAVAALETAARNSFRDALSELKKCSEGPTLTGADPIADGIRRLELSQVAREKQDAAVRAAIEARRPMPFRGGQLVRVGSGTDVVEQCKQILSALIYGGDSEDGSLPGDILPEGEAPG